jgi:hypothetical protein
LSDYFRWNWPVPVQLLQLISKWRLPPHRLHGAGKEPLPEHCEHGVEKAIWVLCPLQRGHTEPSTRMPFASQRAQGPASCVKVPVPEHFRQRTAVVPRPLHWLQGLVRRPEPPHLRQVTAWPGRGLFWADDSSSLVLGEVAPEPAWSSGRSSASLRMTFSAFFLFSVSRLRFSI